jgi:hypothetical protein
MMRGARVVNASPTRDFPVRNAIDHKKPLYFQGKIDRAF